jgi:DNA-binding NtrC family response regulator
MSHRILIVDDESDILSALETHCSLMGYETQTTNDSLEALERVQIEKFHIVLSDINMPKMNGVELLHKIKVIKPSIQVVMITAYTTMEKAIDCWEGGAADYILKPFSDLEQIGEIIDLTSQRISRWEDIAKKSIHA